MGRDPITGEPLGRAYPEYRTVAERIEARTEALDPSLGPASRAEAVAAIEAEEAERGMRRARGSFPIGLAPPPTSAARKKIGVGAAEAPTVIIVTAAGAAVR